MSQPSLPGARWRWVRLGGFSLSCLSPPPATSAALHSHTYAPSERVEGLTQPLECSELIAAAVCSGEGGRNSPTPAGSEGLASGFGGHFAASLPIQVVKSTCRVYKEALEAQRLISAALSDVV